MLYLDPPLPQAEEVVVRIPGLQRRYQFWHISDAHLTASRPDAPLAEQKLADERAFFWGKFGVLPEQALQGFLAFAAKRRTDGILMAGDMLDYYTDDNLQKLQEMLSAQPHECFYAFGNHESSPAFAPVESPALYYPRYADRMQGSPDFWVRDYEEFLLVGVDDSALQISDAQLQKLDAVFARKKPVILLLHIPLMTESIYAPVMEHWGPTFMLGTPDDPENARLFRERICAPDSPVAAIFAGHLHFAHTGEFAPGRWQYVSAPLFTRFVRKVKLIAE